MTSHIRETLCAMFIEGVYMKQCSVCKEVKFRVMTNKYMPDGVVLMTEKTLAKFVSSTHNKDYAAAQRVLDEWTADKKIKLDFDEWLKERLNSK